MAWYSGFPNTFKIYFQQWKLWSKPKILSSLKPQWVLPGKTLSLPPSYTKPRQPTISVN